MEPYLVPGPNPTMIAINVNDWYWENKNNYFKSNF